MIVLDCSAAVDIVRRTPKGAILTERIFNKGPVVSSSLMHAELASALKKYVAAGLMSREDALGKMQLIDQLVDSYASLAPDRVEALAESMRLNHSSYDMFYFVLARHNAATLVTLDRALARLCEQEGVSCLGPDDLAADNVLFMSRSHDTGVQDDPGEGPDPAEG